MSKVEFFECVMIVIDKNDCQDQVIVRMGEFVEILCSSGVRIRGIVKKVEYSSYEEMLDELVLYDEDNHITVRIVAQDIKDIITG